MIVLFMGYDKYLLYLNIQSMMLRYTAIASDIARVAECGSHHINLHSIISILELVKAVLNFGCEPN